MGIKTIDEMMEELQNWDFLQLLPEKIGNFELEKPFERLELEVVVARYKGPEDCALEICYTQETGDFVVTKNVGLFRFRDDRFYCCDKDKFVSRFLPNLTSEIGEIDKGMIHEYPCTAHFLEFDKWRDWEKLPRQHGDFKVYITPDNPLKYLNGSWVLFAYEDRLHKHQLAVFYNEYRNEVFAELKRAGVYEYTKKFDVVFDEVKYFGKIPTFLKDVMKKMEDNLLSTLDELSSQKSC